MIHKDNIGFESQQLIHKISLASPPVELFRIKNASVRNNTLFLEEQLHRHLKLPTMYKSWFGAQINHLVCASNTGFSPHKNFSKNDLMIFDTWGITSYYHLLIDHIIPLWITKKFLKEELNILLGDIDYLRISNNDYNFELHNTQDIFKYFLGKEFNESINNTYNEIIYGYFYSYRPYHGPNYPIEIFQSYKKYLSRFREIFCLFEDNLIDNKILIPSRLSRNFEYVDRFVQKYSHRFNFEIIDFGVLSVKDQIKASGSCRGMFGCEGAAFANIVFMPSNSIVAPVSNNSESFLFHYTLSNYIGHQFQSILINSNGESSIKNDDLLRLFEE